MVKNNMCGLVCRSKYNDIVYILVTVDNTGKIKLPKTRYDNDETLINTVDKICESVLEYSSKLEEYNYVRKLVLNHSIYFLKDMENYCVYYNSLKNKNNLFWLTYNELNELKNVCNSDLKLLINPKKIWYKTNIFEIKNTSSYCEVIN